MSSKELRIVKNCFFVREASRYHRIDFSRIRYIEARKAYCRIDTIDRIRMVAIGITQLEEVLPKDAFCRIHRSYIVGIAHIEWFEKAVLRVAEQDLPIGDSYRAQLHRRVTLVPGESPKARFVAAIKGLILV
jgi:two-component system LytT family response regulator